MKAAVVSAANTNWEIKDIPTPEPMPNQVLIKVRASGVCYTDIHQTRGDLPGAFPRVLGHEAVGEVVKLGPGVRTRRLGDRVGVPWMQATCGRCEWCTRGKPMFCFQGMGTGTTMPGGHAEYMLAYADATVVLPGKLSYEQAAPILCAGYTAWSGLRWADPKPGERIAVVGIGGLGHLAIQFAKAAGFYTIAVSRTSDKDALIRELGADEIVRNGDELARIRGADVILGTSNSADAMSDSIKGLRPDGRLVPMGYESKPLQISLSDLINRRIRIIGSQQNGREYLYEALEMAAQGKVKVIAETYPLIDAVRAFDRVSEGKVRFRAVLVH